MPEFFNFTVWNRTGVGSGEEDPLPWRKGWENRGFPRGEISCREHKIKVMGQRRWW